KVFDSVSHQHIFQTLKQRVVDSHIIDVITDMYESTITCLEVREKQSEVIKILTGVKEGDSMSLMLFSLPIDSLLYSLEKIRNCFKHSSKRVTSLAFADDLVLISDSWDGMQGNIVVVEEFCQLTGLRMQAEK
ncbi:PO21 protein, partial [Casuarius casuarius]|nr:PO21 protein [Casuarius casuarius]